jgi:hypothetical protein
VVRIQPPSHRQSSRYVAIGRAICGTRAASVRSYDYGTNDRCRTVRCATIVEGALAHRIQFSQACGRHAACSAPQRFALRVSWLAWTNASTHLVSNSTGADACHSIEKSLRCPESWCETLERRERRRMGVTCMHAFTFLPAVDLFVVTSRPIFINQARVVLDTEHVSRT